MNTRTTMLAALLLSTSCGGAPPNDVDRHRAVAAESRGGLTESALDSINAITDRLARSISGKDAAGAADRVPGDSTIVYVSDGASIRGSDYVDVLERFYSSVDSIEFGWTKKEVVFPTPRAAVVTAWASIRVLDPDGGWSDAPAIFTLVYRRGNEGQWHYVTSHKTSLSPVPTEVRSQSRPIDEVLGVFREIERAFTAGDLDGLMAVVAEDAVFMPPGLPPLEGRAAVREFYGRLMETYRLEVRAEIHDVSEAENGDLVVVRAEILGRLLPKAGGEPVVVHNKFVNVYERGQDGRWKLSLDIWNAMPPGSGEGPE